MKVIAINGSVLVFGLCLQTSFAQSQNWALTGAPTNLPWNSVTLSADGTISAATAMSKVVYTSTNSGATWLSNSNGGLNFSFGNLVSIASSADESKLAVVLAPDIGAYVSTNFGVSWSFLGFSAFPVGFYDDYSGIACSADGSTVEFVSNDAQNDGTFVNPGDTFYSTPTSGGLQYGWFPNALWSSVAMSTNGTKVIVASHDGLIGTSTDSGNTGSIAVVPALNWTSVASSADGTKLIAVASDGSIYTSPNAGTGWTSNRVAGASWVSVTSSRDGAKLAVASTNGWIYTSADSGGTWQSNDVPSLAWTAVSSSADGSKILATSSAGIYLLQPQPALQIESAGNALLFTWPTSAVGYQLQQSTNLNSTNWTMVPTELLSTNGENQVKTVSGTGSMFYRLKYP